MTCYVHESIRLGLGLGVLLLASGVQAESPVAAGGSDAGAVLAVVQLRMQAELRPEGNQIELSYEASNPGSQPVVLHNRGSAIGSRQSPDWREPVLDSDGGLTVEAMPIEAPQFHGGRTGPYQPPTGLAMRLDPGRTHRQTLTLNPPEGTRRVRFCLGVSTYSEQAFPAYAPLPTDADGIPLLRSPWRQQLDDLREVCTPWLELLD